MVEFKEDSKVISNEAKSKGKTVTKNSENSDLQFAKNDQPFPSYFFSHGGPTFMYENDPQGNKGAWNTIRRLGANIKFEWKPDYLLVVSAHWQSEGEDLIEVNVATEDSGENSLIYDFNGFPEHMYKETFRSLNSSVVAESVRKELEKNGFRSKLTKRGLDHGVWVPFKVAFSGQGASNEELDLPETKVIQISLTSKDTDFATHFKLGEVLSKFRENSVWDESSQKYLKGAVLFSGMSVHNLRDLRSGAVPSGTVAPYAPVFNTLLTKTIENSKSILEDLEAIRENHSKLLYDAHPTLEHFLPIVAAGGLASKSNLTVKEVYNQTDRSLGWGIYQFGENY